MATKPRSSSAHRSRRSISRPMLERLARYHQIATRAGEEGHETLASAKLAALLGVDPTLVRKDMAAAGIQGRPRVGYAIGALLAQLDEVLGLSRRNEAIIVGCGGLGGAIINYAGFVRYGLKIVAAFDTDPGKVGRSIGGLPVLPMEKCKSSIATFGVELAIVTVPAESAQRVCDELTRIGIRAIWNFAPVELRLPPQIVVRQENLGLGLAQLLHQVSSRRRRERRAS